MKSYLGNLKDIFENGTLKKNRTGVDTISITGTMIKHNLTEGFPLITTKKMYTNQMVGELIGFLRGYDNANDFRKLGCTIWDANANENETWLNSIYRKCEDDLGRIYGVQWRRRRDTKFEMDIKKQQLLANSGYTAKRGHIFLREFDQLDWCIEEIKNNPTNRRIIMSAWNPAEDAEMALPPCHCTYHFIPNGDKLDLCMHQRSADYFLGVPFNVASASLLLSIIAKVTGYEPGIFTHFMDDSHIYVNHKEQVQLQLEREPLELCRLEIDDSNWYQSNIDELVNSIEPDNFKFNNYNHHPAIAGKMAV